MDTYWIVGVTHVYLGKYVGRELFVTLGFVLFFATYLFFQFLQ